MSGFNADFDSAFVSHLVIMSSSIFLRQSIIFGSSRYWVVKLIVFFRTVFWYFCNSWQNGVKDASWKWIITTVGKFDFWCYFRKYNSLAINVYKFLHGNKKYRCLVEKDLEKFFYENCFENAFVTLVFMVVVITNGVLSFIGDSVITFR